MLVTDKLTIAKRLQDQIPLLTKHWPVGWKDFRQELPMEWRSDLYVKLPSEPPIKCNLDGDTVEAPSLESLDDPITDIQMHCRFASLQIACEAAMQIRERCQCSVMVEECRHNCWKVSFSVPAQEVCW